MKEPSPFYNLSITSNSDSIISSVAPLIKNFLFPSSLIVNRSSNYSLSFNKSKH